MTGGGRQFGYANDRLTVIEDEAAASRDAARRVRLADPRTTLRATPGTNLDRHHAYILAAYMTSGN